MNASSSLYREVNLLIDSTRSMTIYAQQMTFDIIEEFTHLFFKSPEHLDRVILLWIIKEDNHSILLIYGSIDVI